MSHFNLSEIFGQYVGQEVEMTVGIPEQTDPVLISMKQTADENGLGFRIWWPGVVGGTTDMQPDRANIYLERQNDGKFTVSNRFEIG
jgi:hypothetical protein